jgi:hypothetical protein
MLSAPGKPKCGGLSMRRIFLLGGMLAALVAAGATTVALKLTKPVIAQQHTDTAVPDPAILNKHLRDMREQMTLP